MPADDCGSCEATKQSLYFKSTNVAFMRSFGYASAGRRLRERASAKQSAAYSNKKCKAQRLRELRSNDYMSCYFISSASSSSIARLSSFKADFTVTTGSTKVISLLFSNIPLITLAAIGAQVPFSIIPIFLF